MSSHSNEQPHKAAGDSKRQAVPAAHTGLSPREKEVHGLIAEGCLDKEIAEKLEIGYETVRTHLRRIFQKLDVRTRTEAAVRFVGQSGN